MIKQKNDSQNFWSGYALGMLGGSILMFAFGTKKGRAAVLKLLEHTDTLENNIEGILKLVQSKITTIENKK